MGRGGKSPDLTILDSHSDLELYRGSSRSSAAQADLASPSTVDRGTAPPADKGSIDTLRTSDFVFHDSPVEVYFDIAPAGTVVSDSTIPRAECRIAACEPSPKSDRAGIGDDEHWAAAAREDIA